ncbi:hypothetical protein Tco_0985085 [Tanacetum coccineum]
MDEYGPLKNRFEYNDKGMMLHVGENAAQWSNLVGELVREFPIKTLTWCPTCASSYGLTSRKASSNISPRSRPPPSVGQSHWDKQIEFWLNPKHVARAAQNAQNQARSMMESFETHEYPSLISTFFDTHTYEGVFTQDEAQIQYVRGDVEAEICLAKEVASGPPGETELDLLRRVVASDDQMSHMLTQLGTQSEINGGSGSGSGGGGDDEPGEDEDDDGDDDI